MDRRDELHKEILIKYKNNGSVKNVFLHMATSLGKSKIAIEIMNYISKNIYNRDGEPPRVLILYPEVFNKKTWSRELDKWGAYTPFISFECYASMKKHEGLPYDVVIFDEYHHLSSSIRSESLSKFTYEKGLYLSATPSSDMEYLRYQATQITFNYPLKYALEKEFLPEPKVIFYLVPLDNTTKDQVYEITRGKGVGMKKDGSINVGKYKDVKIIDCMQGEEWKYLKDKKNYPDMLLKIHGTAKYISDFINARVNAAKSTHIAIGAEWSKYKWLNEASSRKRFLGNSKSKHAKELLDRLSEYRYVCFTTSIDQAEELGGENAIHSKNKDSQIILDKFNRMEIDNIYAVGKLNEGQNLTDIELGIIVQLDLGERLFVQKLGRIMRSEEPVQVVLYYADTRDEEYMKKAIQIVGKEHVLMLDNIEDVVKHVRETIEGKYEENLYEKIEE